MLSNFDVVIASAPARQRMLPTLTRGCRRQSLSSLFGACEGNWTARGHVGNIIILTLWLRWPVRWSMLTKEPAPIRLVADLTDFGMSRSAHTASEGPSERGHTGGE